MKKVFRIITIAVTIAMSMVACQKPEIVEPVVKTHTVEFVSGAPTTKTSAVIDETAGTVSYSWKDTDQNTPQQESKFHVFENNNPATSIAATLSNGVMTITASFAGDRPADAQYTGYFNSGVLSTQNAVGTDYDQSSDVLVAQPTTEYINGQLSLCFERLGAISEMTLKGLKGAKVKSVVVSADQNIAGSLANGELAGDSNTITINCDNVTISGGNAVVRFITLPVADAQLSVKVVTADSDGNAVAQYEKTFGGKISLTKGNLSSFGVGLASSEVPLENVPVPTKTLCITYQNITNPPTTTAITYSSYVWTADGISGVANCASSSNMTYFQFNYDSSKADKYRDRQALYNVTSMPGSIKSIKVTTNTSLESSLERDWTLYVSANPITPDNFTAAISAGTEKVLKTGTSFDVTAGDCCYFYLDYRVGSASYIDSVEVTYEDSNDEEGGDIDEPDTPADGSVITYNFNDANAYPAGFPTAGTNVASAETFTISGHDIIINAPTSYYEINSTTSNRGLFFGKTSALNGVPTDGTAYLAFPAITGKKLTKVVLTTTSGVAGSVKMNIYTTAWSPVSVECTTDASTKRTFTFALSNTTANTEYRLASGTSAKNLQLDNIILCYDGAEPQISKPTPTITTTNKSDLQINTSYDVSQLFRSNSEGAMSYSISDNPDSKGSLASDGKTFSATAKGTYTISVSQAESDGFGAGSATATITVVESSTPSTGDEVVKGASWTSRLLSDVTGTFTTGSTATNLSPTGATEFKWALSKGGATGTIATDQSKGIQLQSNGGIQMTTTNYTGGVEKIVLTLSRSSKGPSMPSVTITVDGKAFRAAQGTSITTTPTDYVFTCTDGVVDATGKTISIKVTSSSSSTYVQYVKINP